MLTKAELKECSKFGVAGSFPMGLIRNYFSLLLQRQISQEDAEQIMTYINNTPAAVR